MSIRHLLLCGLVVTAGALAGCGGGASGASTGTLHIKITDAPFPIGELESAVVSVVSVEARGDSGWTDIGIVGGGPVEIDLYDLRAGLSEQLALEEVPTGSYDEVRLVIDMAKLSFMDSQGALVTRDFRVPSGASSGIKVKIDPPVLVAEGQTSDLLLDVDLTESFHVTGVGGEPTWDDILDDNVIFHPVIRAINEAQTAMLLGLVVDAALLPLADVEVSVFPAGTDVAADPVTDLTARTFSTPAGMQAALGSYALALDPGTYDVYLRLPETNAYLQVRSSLDVAAGDVLTEDLSPPLP